MEQPKDTASADNPSSNAQSSDQAKADRKRRRQRDETWKALEQRESRLNSISSSDPSLQPKRPEPDSAKPGGEKRDHHGAVAQEISARYIRLDRKSVV